MGKNNRSWNSVFGIIISAVLVLRGLAHGQGRQDPGKSIGTISVRGELIVMTLTEGALGKASLFDLVHRTLALHSGCNRVPRRESGMAMGIRLRPRNGEQRDDFKELLLSLLRPKVDLLFRWTNRVHNIR